mmetsp:Transcript_3197/g.7734  ORF Transcript_3197/g.7734 Transcript_3197/m.7734 type:complete len:159 (+) Transcript_3197:201-677(+)
MGNSIDKVSDRLYITGVAGAMNKEKLKELGITHVLCCPQKCPEAYFPQEFQYHIVGVDDTSTVNLRPHFKPAIEFIHEGVQKGGTLVHCMAGVSRASSFTIAYLMAKEGLPLAAAHKTVKDARDCICPNVGFWLQLQEFEQILIADRAAEETSASSQN